MGDDDDEDEEGGGASCGGASCEACQEEGHEEGNEGSHEESDEEEGLSELSRTPLEGPSVFQSSGVALFDMNGQVGIYSTCTFEVCAFEVCRSLHVELTACERRAKKK